MDDRTTIRRWGVIAALFGALVLCAAPAGAAPTRPGPAPIAGSTARQAAFTAAAKEFGVPEPVLLAVSYNLSRWENHAGAPSFAGGYGPMHLTHLDSTPSDDAKGDGTPRPPRDTRGVTSLHTLDAAAALLGISPGLLRGNPIQNIRGGAALLAQYARDANGKLPTNEADWYGAVMRYSQASDARTAASFADQVYATLRQGAARTTDDGETLTLAAADIAPNKPASVLALSATTAPCIDAPADITCEYIPAAYAKTSTGYGNYDLANRMVTPPSATPYPKIRYIVIHDTEGSYAGTLSVFQDPSYGASAHYVVRSSDGHVAQMIETKNVAWHAGNWYVNGNAIGIEHEGYAIAGASWYTENMYQASASLVRYLAARYSIPLDRAHIVGHDDIPGPTSSYQAGMHWDPGPFWDWAHYMDLLQAPGGSADSGTAKIVTLRISPSSNTQTVKDCEGSGTLITQGANFVYLRTAPSATAAYITNPYLSGDPLCANNWGNKAVSGQTFYRFATSGSWDGIYFGGQQAWFYNPGHSLTVVGSATLIKPKGKTAISVYGRAYPERSAYPSGVTVQTVSAISNYKIPAGQIYVAYGPFNSDYFYAPTYTLNVSDNKDIQGSTQYYQIFFNHRFAFVQAADVALATP